MEKDSHLRASDHFLAAVLKNDFSEMSNLFKTGFSADSFKENGSKWLRAAAAKGSLESVKMLIDFGVDVNMPDPKLGTTALHNAAALLSPSICLALLEAGARVDSVDFGGGSALHIAVTFSKPACAIALIQAGANMTIKNNNGFSAMDCSKVAKQAFGPHGINQIEAFLNAMQALEAVNSVVSAVLVAQKHPTTAFDH